jgi:hypothetical protein
MSGKFPNICRLNNTVLTKPEDKGKLTRGIGKYFELSQNNNKQA